MKNFAILTATLEALGDGRTHSNLVRNSELCARLNTDGRNFESCTGYYNGVNQGESFLVHAITEAEALEYARAFGQESIITDAGLVFTDGRPTWRTLGTLYGEAARANGNYTVDSSGRCYSFALAVLA